MISRIFFFLIGFGFSTIGFAFMISYLNIITFGYSLLEYVNYISKRPECILGIIGLIIITITIFIPGGTDELHIWYIYKFSK